MSVPLGDPLFGGVDPQLPEPRRGGGREGQSGRAGGRFEQCCGGGGFGPSEIHQQRRSFPASREQRGIDFFFSPRGAKGSGFVEAEDAIIAVRPNGLPRAEFGW